MEVRKEQQKKLWECLVVSFTDDQGMVTVASTV